MFCKELSECSFLCILSPAPQIHAQPHLDIDFLLWIMMAFEGDRGILRRFFISIPLSIPLSMHPSGNTLPRRVCCSRFFKTQNPTPPPNGAKALVTARRGFEGELYEMFFFSSSNTSLFTPVDIATWSSFPKRKKKKKNHRCYMSGLVFHSAQTKA